MQSIQINDISGTKGNNGSRGVRGPQGMPQVYCKHTLISSPCVQQFHFAMCQGRGDQGTGNYAFRNEYSYWFVYNE